MTAVIADTDAVQRVARENVEDAAREGLDYVELRFSPYFHRVRSTSIPRRLLQRLSPALPRGARQPASA